MLTTILRIVCYLYILFGMLWNCWMVSNECDCIIVSQLCVSLERDGLSTEQHYAT